MSGGRPAPTRRLERLDADQFTPCGAKGFADKLVSVGLGTQFDVAHFERDAAPRIAVVVDVEEEFDWSAPFSPRHRTVTGNGNLHLIQEICDDFGLIPAYVIDYVAAGVDGLAADIKRWLGEGRCQLGAQLHTWVTPPHDEVICVENSYQCNLRGDLEARKMERLTDRIETSIGTRPAIFKAGRYGIGSRTVGLLIELGYKVDTSVVPRTDYRGLGGGPDFSRAPHWPFWLDRQHRLLEIPLSRTMIGPMARQLGRSASWLFDSRLGARIRLPGIASRLFGLERLTLSPEGSAGDDMKRFLGYEIGQGQRIFTLSLHSSSLVVGGSPYAATGEDVSRLLARTIKLLRGFVDDFGGRASSILELHEEACQSLDGGPFGPEGGEN